MDHPSHKLTPRNPRRRIRSLRFSLRILLLIVALLAVPSLWLRWRVRSAANERRVMEALSANPNATFTFDHQFDDENAYHPHAELGTPKIVRQALGDEAFKKVGSIVLEDVELNEMLALRLGNLEGIRGLVFKRVTIPEKCSEHLERLASLKWLILTDVKVCNGAYRFLGNQKDLEILIVSGTNFTDREMPLLRDLVSLKNLQLIALPITDDGVRSIGNLEKLAHLNLTRTKITDASLATLAGLPSLQSVLFGGTQVTDEGVKYLKQKLRPGSSVSRHIPTGRLTNAADSDK